MEAIAYIKTDYMLVAFTTEKRWKCAIPTAEEYLNKTFPYGKYAHNSGDFNDVESTVYAANQTLAGEIIWCDTKE